MRPVNSYKLINTCGLHLTPSWAQSVKRESEEVMFHLSLWMWRQVGTDFVAIDAKRDAWMAEAMFKIQRLMLQIPFNLM